MKEQDILVLLHEARVANVQHGVSGLLLYFDGIFMQLIEGPGEAVRQLYANICADNRHAAIETLIDEPITRRLLPAWSMLFRTVDGTVITNTAAMVDFVGMDLSVESTEELIKRRAKVLSLVRDTAGLPLQEIA